MAKQLTSELERLSELEEKESFSLSIGLTKPDHYLNDYDTFIALLKLDISDAVELDMQEFQCYILDQWSWKTRWGTTLKFYSDIDDLSPRHE